MPAIEPVEKCTVVPREKFPLGHTTLAVDEARELTRMWTRRYLREQMMVELAGESFAEKGGSGCGSTEACVGI